MTSTLENSLTRGEDDSARLVLASSSPRRQELIALLGLPYDVVPSLYIEPNAPDYPVDLRVFVTELALAKASEVAGRRTDAYILGADTLVTASDTAIGIPLGKPSDVADAARMLRLLSGRTHYVYTGVAVIPPVHRALQPITACVRTGVRFREMSDAVIAAYVATGEPMDKAGSYGAQGLAAPLIEGIDGDFFNVVGLPVCTVAKILETFGIDRWSVYGAVNTSI